jgi:beta-galactosidase GanA
MAAACWPSQASLRPPPPLPPPPLRPPPHPRYEEDIELARKAGCNAMRLSIEWARIEPRRGEIDMDAVDR